MTFHVGQEVVAIVPPPEAYGGENEGSRAVVLGQTYVIRDIDMRLAGEGVIALRFEGIVNPVIRPHPIFQHLIGEAWEIAYDSRGFRPVIKRKTNISALTALLNHVSPKHLEDA